jgi:hypothetical protein
MIHHEGAKDTKGSLCALVVAGAVLTPAGDRLNRPSFRPVSRNPGFGVALFSDIYQKRTMGKRVWCGNE